MPGDKRGFFERRRRDEETSYKSVTIPFLDGARS